MKQYVLTRFHRTKIREARRREAQPGYQSVLSVDDGAATFDSGHYAIFLIWQPKQLPWYVLNVLEAMYQERVNVILVANHELTPEQREYLGTRTAKIMVRDNSGFDIGGYRDASRYLLSSGIKPRKLIYMNDSVYYLERGLNRMIRGLLDEPTDVVGTFENWEIYHHIQSFCMSISGDVFGSAAFARFWQDYLAVDSRLWAIEQGEVGLSRAIMTSAKSVKILYQVNELRQQLAKHSASELADMSRYLPEPVRASPRIYSVYPVHRLANEICERVLLRSQIHTGAFYYMKYFESPLIKRDLVYRLMFKIDDIERNLRSVGCTEHLDDIMADFRRKGMGLALKGMMLERFYEGLI